MDAGQTQQIEALRFQREVIEDQGASEAVQRGGDFRNFVAEFDRGRGIDFEGDHSFRQRRFRQAQFDEFDEMLIVQRGGREIHRKHDRGGFPDFRMMHQVSDEFGDHAAINHRSQAMLDGGFQHCLRGCVWRVIGLRAQQHLVALELAALGQRHQALYMQRNGAAAQRGVQAIDFRRDSPLQGLVGASGRGSHGRHGRPRGRGGR